MAGTTRSSTKGTASSATTTVQSGSAAGVQSGSEKPLEPEANRESAPVGENEPEAGSGRTIATWKPGKGNPFLRREVTKAQAKSALLVELEEDLVWGPETNWRVDVSNVPEALLDSLKSEANAEGKKDFSFSEE